MRLELDALCEPGQEFPGCKQTLTNLWTRNRFMFFLRTHDGIERRTQVQNLPVTCSTDPERQAVPALPCNSKDSLHQVQKAKFDCEVPSYSEKKKADASRAKAALPFQQKTWSCKKALRLHRLEWAPPRHDNNFWNCDAQEDALRHQQWSSEITCSICALNNLQAAIKATQFALQHLYSICVYM